MSKLGLVLPLNDSGIYGNNDAGETFMFWQDVAFPNATTAPETKRMAPMQIASDALPLIVDSAPTGQTSAQSSVIDQLIAGVKAHPLAAAVAVFGALYFLKDKRG